MSLLFEEIDELIEPRVPRGERIDLWQSFGALKMELGGNDTHTREFLLSRLHLFSDGCKACKRANCRTNTVNGEGSVNASVFILADAPCWPDDRTGIPLVGSIGLYASSCTVCHSYDECWKHPDWMKPDPDLCLLQPGVGETVQASRIRQVPQLISPGRLLDETFRKIGLARDHWQALAALRARLGLSSTQPPAANVFVSLLVRCFTPLAEGGYQAPTEEEIKACSTWLEAERKLVSAPVTVCLGDQAAAALGVKRPTSPGVSNTLPDRPEWGHVFATWHPAQILPFSEDCAHGKAARAHLTNTLAAAFTRANAILSPDSTNHELFTSSQS